MSRQSEILEAASRVIVNLGLNKLTLEMVAKEAGISKGGLLYHFPNKEELLTALNVYALEEFKKKIDLEMVNIKEENGRFLRAYALATLNELRDSNHILLNSSLLASLANNIEALTLWKKQYEQWELDFKREKVKREEVLTIRFVCDGLWFSSMFQLDVIEKEEAVHLIKYLLGKLEEV
ncbi:AcrR family transcriptional regulator [Metabacillus crassostreae]|uniref:TetR/AcrR family transcriptional regulator n=1 Tax=Metabacillus crassostreae TaxID=929098 RepID=UPI0019574F95|nr:TetR/AcrR family transcriptional regulator [Metabacillus crassostreae]MBM7603720.1 AcrR family transcriptional regulator [Metabacillus crassostreae]